MNAEEIARANRYATADTMPGGGVVVDIAGVQVRIKIVMPGRLHIWTDVPSVAGPLVQPDGSVPLDVGVGEMTLYATDAQGKNPWHRVPAWGAP